MGFRPLMTRKRIEMMAITRRRWMSPPIVYDETMPSTQSTTRIIAMVYSIVVRLWRGVAGGHLKGERPSQGTVHRSAAVPLGMALLWAGAAVRPATAQEAAPPRYFT